MIIPIFRIFDRQKMKEFYLDYLGFTLDWEHHFEADMPAYLQVSLDGVILHLTEHHGDASPGGTVRIQKDRLKEYHAALKEKKYTYMNPGIEETPWDMKEVTVIDPFSNKIIFYD